MDDPADPRDALVYAEAVRSLSQQQAVVESVRSRAGIPTVSGNPGDE
jgi:hypothetical protein